MTAAIIGLLGATFGAVTALIGSALSDHRQAKLEDIRWRRDQRVAAYQGALRALLRARLHRFPSKVPGEADEWRRLRTESINAWHDKLVDTEFWLHTLLSRCDMAEAPRLNGVVTSVDIAIHDAIDAPNTDALNEVLQAAATAVSECSRLYLAQTIA